MVFLSLSIHIVMSFKRALNESATPRFQAVFLFRLQAPLRYRPPLFIRAPKTTEVGKLARLRRQQNGGGGEGSGPDSVDREARIVTNPVFGRISDSVKPPSGQQLSGGKTPLKRPENLSFLTQVDGCECPRARWSCQTQVNLALVITENRVCSLARYKPPILIPFPPTKGVGVSIGTLHL